MSVFSIIRTIATAALLTVSLASCEMLGPSAQDKARLAYEEQDYLAARDYANEALADDAQDAAALEVLLRVQLAMGEGAEALNSLRQLAHLEALPRDHRLLEAEAHLQAGNLAPVADLLEGQHTAESWRLRALAATLALDDDGALAAFARGQDAAGDKARLLVAEATFHLRRENRDAARAAVARAQKIAPRRAETQFVTGWLAQLEGNYEIAARAFLAILANSPHDRPAMLGAIDASQRLDRDDVADPIIAQGRSAYPGDLSFIYFASRAHARKGNWAAARDLLQEREAELAGQDPAHLLYAEALLELGQGELARAIVTPIHSRRRDDRDVAALYERAVKATSG